MTQAAVLNVFCNSSGTHGNPVAIIEDLNREFTPDQRQRLALKTGFSETIFIEDLPTGKIKTHNPQEEISFAGHAAVGAAHYLSRRLKQPIEKLMGREGPIHVSVDERETWVRVALVSTPPWLIERLASVEHLESLTGPEDPSQGYTLLWAWLNEPAGAIRARTFAPNWGIPEDEANGSGCMRLACTLGREIEVTHGVGSVVLARPSGAGHGEVGGAVAEVGTIDLAL